MFVVGINSAQLMFHRRFFVYYLFLVSSNRLLISTKKQFWFFLLFFFWQIVLFKQNDVENIRSNLYIQIKCTLQHLFNSMWCAYNPRLIDHIFLIRKSKMNCYSASICEANKISAENQENHTKKRIEDFGGKVIDGVISLLCSIGCKWHPW